MSRRDCLCLAAAWLGTVLFIVGTLALVAALEASCTHEDRVETARDFVHCVERTTEQATDRAFDELELRAHDAGADR